MPLDLEKLDLVDALPSQIKGDPLSYQTGWYKVGSSKDFFEGKLFSVVNFPSKLVIWRTLSGKLVVLDTYCLHMGADLSCGQLSEKGITCPFHGWRWGEDGKCNDIPYSKDIPKDAKAKSWVSKEDSGFVYIWYDKDGKNPINQASLLEI
jgi:3-ketosteroid 9alpha-monooxygenase subunit A